MTLENNRASQRDRGRKASRENALHTGASTCLVTDLDSLTPRDIQAQHNIELQSEEEQEVGWQSSGLVADSSRLLQAPSSHTQACR